MKIWVFTLCRNELDILPFYLRNYEAIADKIMVWDDASTDGSRELLSAHPKVVLNDWPYPNSGIDEDLFLKFAYETYPIACGNADWAIWCDCDEIIHSSDLIGNLEDANSKGFEVVKPSGFNMVGKGLPRDDGKRQIWQIHQIGVKASVYAKPAIFKPCSTIRWNRGKHDLECDAKLGHYPQIKLLHYRYMGEYYTQLRNARNYARVGLMTGDKGAGWSCRPDWTGEHSATWAEAAISHGYNVITNDP